MDPFDWRPDPKFDASSAEELFELAMEELLEGEEPNALSALHWRGTQEVHLRAIELTESDSEMERVLGVQVLAEFHVPCIDLRPEIVERFLRMLSHEQDAEVIAALFHGLFVQHEPRLVSAAKYFVDHPDPLVRESIASALGSNHKRQDAVQVLMQLMDDPEPSVRYWATFSLGTQLNQIDTPTVRQHLVLKLQDPDQETRGEALVGLARRNDDRVAEIVLDDNVDLYSAEYLRKAKYWLQNWREQLKLY